MQTVTRKIFIKKNTVDPAPFGPLRHEAHLVSSLQDLFKDQEKRIASAVIATCLSPKLRGLFLFEFFVSQSAGGCFDLQNLVFGLHVGRAVFSLAWYLYAVQGESSSYPNTKTANFNAVGFGKPYLLCFKGCFFLIPQPDFMSAFIDGPCFGDPRPQKAY